MYIKDEIYRYVEGLPDALQMELLIFLKYLYAKAQNQTNESDDWSSVSVSMAMMGMEDEPELYSLEDIQAPFS